MKELKWKWLNISGTNLHLVILQTLSPISQTYSEQLGNISPACAAQKPNHWPLGLGTSVLPAELQLLVVKGQRFNYLKVISSKFSGLSTTGFLDDVSVNKLVTCFSYWTQGHSYCCAAVLVLLLLTIKLTMCSYIFSQYIQFSAKGLVLSTDFIKTFSWLI